MQNTATKTRAKYERKLEKCISKSGGINLKYEDGYITAIQIAEPKELYAVDNVEIISVDVIMQEINTGKVMIHNEKFGLISFDFDFVGSFKECSNYIDELGSNEITLDELLKGATPEMLKLLLQRAKQHEEEIQEEKQPLTVDENTTIQEFLNMVANNKEGLNIELKGVIQEEPIKGTKPRYLKSKPHDLLTQSLAKVLELDLKIDDFEAYRLIEDSFYNLYPKGGSVETYAVLEQAYKQYESLEVEF